MDKKYCTNCGTENVSNASFCISCGSSFEAKPVEENVVEETPIVNETPVVNTEAQTPSVTPEPPKKKKGKGCLIAIIVILLIAGLIVGGIFLFKKLTYFEDPFENSKTAEKTEMSNYKDLGTQLNEDLTSGKISKDEYIMQLAYSFYEPSRVNEIYSSLPSDAIGFEDFYAEVEKYINDLSLDTKYYLFTKFNLSDYSWPDVDEVSYDDEISATVAYMSNNKPDGNIRKLDGVVLSKEGHFLVFYSTEGRYPTKRSQAKKIAKYLESLVIKYKEEYKLDYSYSIQWNNGDGLTKPFSYGNVKKLLDENNIDEEYLSTAMPVYVIDNEAEKSNHSGFYTPKLDNGILRALADAGSVIQTNDVETNISYTTYAYPYFVLSSSLVGTDDQNLVAAHELFHHYQYLICGNGGYSKCASSEFTTETTASQVAAHVYKANKTNTQFNSHAGIFLDGINKDKGIYYMAKFGGAAGGYVSYVFANSYEEVVPNGANVMFNSMKTTEPLQYIYDNSNGKYAKAVMKTSEKILTLDYDNKAMIPYDYDGTRIYPKNRYDLPGSFGVQSKYVATSGFDYYFIKTYNYPEKAQLSFSKTFDMDKDLYLLLFIKENDKYRLVYTHNLDTDFVMNIDDFRYYDDVGFAIVNGGISNEILYTFKIIEDEREKPTVTAKSLGLKDPSARKNNKKNNKKNVVKSSIVCTQVEDVEYIKSTYQVLVEFGHNDDIKDMYVKGTVEMEEDNAAFKIAKGITTGAVFLLKQKYKEQFGKITLRTYDEGNKYIILGRVKKDVDTAARNSFGTNDLTREGIFKAIEDKGFTCEYR